MKKNNFLKSFCVFYLFFLVEGVFLQGLCLASSARVVKNVEEVIPVRTKIGGITEIEFEEKIANVAKGIPSDVLQIETLENRIFLLPLQDVDSEIYVVTQDNVSYGFHVKNLEGEHDIHLKVLRPAAKTISTETNETNTTIAVMKDLLLGKQPVGSTLLPTPQYEIFNNGWMKLVVNEVFELQNGVRALVLTAENLIDRPIVFPIQNIDLPGLLAVAVDAQVLEARPLAKGKSNGEKKYMTKVFMIVQGYG